MLNPVSTYRIQFHKNFNFSDLEKIIPYLRKLGVKTVYASPILAATPGSMHGYDGVDPQKINPEIGTEEAFRRLVRELQEHGIGWVQDIVPNHLAFHPSNGWLMDVLEKGQKSIYASFFDIGWTGATYNGRLMVPFLGADPAEVIRNGELKIIYHNRRLLIAYYENQYPVSPASYVSVLTTGEGTPPQELQKLTEDIQHLQEEASKEAFASRWDSLLGQLASLMEREDIRGYVEWRLQEANKDPQKMMQITEEQVYRLCYWKETDHKINYRRFFTINGLICLNIQHPEVFDACHKLIKSFSEEGLIKGLRVDHIDGLYDPSAYLERLRELAGPDMYLVTEKILEPGEHLPEGWDIQGTTGYDFLSIVNNLFTDPLNEDVFSGFYKKLTGDIRPVHDLITEKKAYILYRHMGGELENLFRLFIELNLAEEKVIANLGHDLLKQAIARFLTEFPVYRLYGNEFPLKEQEQKEVQEVLRRMTDLREDLKPAARLLEDTLIRRPAEGNEDYNNRAKHFYMRCMQFTGPLMAKGVEDTLMYSYNRFIGHNEVGDSPESFGITPEDFHRKMLHRQRHWPLSMNATATHDTKRGEDVSARLNVLTDLGEEWIHTVEKWQQMNIDLRVQGSPDANDEYFIYQTLVGAYPMPGQDEDNFGQRFGEYIVKALREAKQHSDWSEPDTKYEEAATGFARGLLDRDRPFWKSFQKLHQKVADGGIVNSLSKVLLKFTCPGVPDTYQGCELWDLSFVDPDNRRPVNYEHRTNLLDRIGSVKESPEAVLSSLWEKRYDAGIKMWLVHTLLGERQRCPELFSEGQYVPLEVQGKYRENITAFARRYKNTWLLVAVPLHAVQLASKQKTTINRIDWKDTHIVLPAEAPEAWEHVFIHSRGKQKQHLMINEIFREIPLALLRMSYPVTDRSAGILMHISSLPSPFGIGDFGPEAKAFAGFLARSRQKHWQILPLNPTEAVMGHSPYSSISSMAGNTLLISPELLAAEGLLTNKEIASHFLPVKAEADFKEAERIKEMLFEKAYRNFRRHAAGESVLLFRQFCRKEAYWLDDFALYLTLKEQFRGGWYQWPENYKLRNKEALNEFAVANSDKLEKIKWLQFIFGKQWQELKAHCNNLGIQMVGDLPFYVSYDSADVWANPEIFSIDSDGNITGVAGVPPDYFNADGQLWGMPVFRWDVLKDRGYDWWVRRIRKNMELYDLLRLDHFRAFADYWEVPSGEKTAKKGEWKPGPGSDFFLTLQKELGGLPFIAEDLGDINELVHRLRDEFRLPGMKVLQFAFGDDLPGSIYIPHNYQPNYIAYTGTHDNNTTVGWFRENTGKTERKNLKRYTGIKVSQKNVHKALMRLAYSSVAKTVIIPVQDVLGLDESARMNTPASTGRNWAWRLRKDGLHPKHEKLLRKWVKLYNR